MKKNFRIHNFRPFSNASISLCMIAKNEAKRLPRCLKSIYELVDEVIIVDTGSIDNTVHLAKSYGCKVFIHPWDDDFSRSRNFSLSYATKEWILVLDPDEIINPSDFLHIKQLTNNPNISAYQMPTRNYSNDYTQFSFIKCTNDYPESYGYNGHVISTKTRFFRNGLGIKFKGCYHEMADYYCFDNKIPGLKTTIPIHHWSHEICQNSLKEKSDFYLRLANKKVLEEPNNDHAWFEKATTEAIGGLRKEAVSSILRSLELGPKTDQKYILLYQILKKLEMHKLADIALQKSVCHSKYNLTHTDKNLINDSIFSSIC